MPNRHVHVARESRDTPTYHGGFIHRKEICQICGWVREFAVPIRSGSSWFYGDWQPPERVTLLKDRRKAAS